MVTLGSTCHPAGYSYLQNQRQPGEMRSRAHWGKEAKESTKVTEAAGTGRGWSVTHLADPAGKPKGDVSESAALAPVPLSSKQLAQGAVTAVYTFVRHPGPGVSFLSSAMASPVQNRATFVWEFK